MFVIISISLLVCSPCLSIVLGHNCLTNIIDPELTADLQNFALFNSVFKHFFFLAIFVLAHLLARLKSFILINQYIYH